MKILRFTRWLVLVALLSLVPATSHAGVFISVGFAPPVLPVYVQPPCPPPGLMWTPGRWGSGPDWHYWGSGALCGRTVDSRLLGLGRLPGCLASRGLGHARGLLRRRKLRLRVHGHKL